MKSPNAIHVMKTYAHDLIYDLQILGLSKRKIYLELSRRMGVPLKDAHIGNMISVDKVGKAIGKLEIMNRIYETKYKKKKTTIKKKNPPQVQNPPKKQPLPQSEMGISFKALRIQRQHPKLYKYAPRIFYFLYGKDIVG